MNFDLSSLLIGIIAMDIVACIEVIIFANIIKKRMSWRMRPYKIRRVAPAIITEVKTQRTQNTQPERKTVERTVYRDARGRFCRKEDAVNI